MRFPSSLTDLFRVEVMHLPRPPRLWITSLLFLLLLIVFSHRLVAATITLDFEGFPDSTTLDTQYPGLTFSNTIILTAGISLNEFEFPPHSGSNVVSDNGGPLTIAFITPVFFFGGFFTYAEPLTLAAFDASSNRVAQGISTFSSNDALVGDPGSSPNEFLSVSFLAGISSVTITGDPAGGSFVLDDATITAPDVPEPSSALLSLTVAIGIFLASHKTSMTKLRFVITSVLALFLVSLGGIWLYGQQTLPPASGVQGQWPAPPPGAPSTHLIRTPPLSTGVTPTIGTPSTTPSFITVNTQKTVTVTVSISPTPLPNGVNLIRLGATGTQPTILGVMHDDGLNGDQTPGDGVYTLQVPFSEPTTSYIQLQVSSAFEGLLKRYYSPPITLGVWGIIVDSVFTAMTPPGWTSTSSQDSYTLSSTTTAPVFEGDPGNELILNLLPLNNFNDLLSWLQDYYSGEVDFTNQPVTYYTNPNGVRFAIVNALPGMSSDNSHAFAIIKAQVLEVSITPASKYGSLFYSMLSMIKSN